MAEAPLYESRRAVDLAAVTGAALDRFAEAGAFMPAIRPRRSPCRA